jgi:hypothetical protein
MIMFIYHYIGNALFGGYGKSAGGSGGSYYLPGNDRSTW